MKKWILLTGILMVALQSSAQWTLQPGIGMSIPLTGYSTIVKTGTLVQFDNLNYVPPASAGKTIFNTSFSVMPRLGLRKKVNNYYPFFEVNCPLVMDGLPAGVDQGEKITGYVGLAVGVAYHL